MQDPTKCVVLSILLVYKCTSQAPSRSVQSFLQGLPLWPTDRRTTLHVKHYARRMVYCELQCGVIISSCYSRQVVRGPLLLNNIENIDCKQFWAFLTISVTPKVPIPIVPSGSPINAWFLVTQSLRTEEHLDPFTRFSISTHGREQRT